MKRDGRLSGVLHLVLHLAHQDGPVTSEVLAKVMDTHPVVVRRVLAGLRKQGYIRSEKGHGGGWVLSRDLGEVTLLDLYNALGKPPLLAMGHRSEAPGCLVEEVVNIALDKSFADAEALLLTRMSEVTLGSLSAKVSGRLRARRQTLGHRHLEKIHA